MPFDVLVMRAVTSELEPLVTDGRIEAVRQEGDRVYVSGATKTGAPWHIELGLHPRFRRILSTQRVPKTVRPAVWAAPLIDARVAMTEQPPWERCWRWTLEPADSIRGPFTLVVELAGHLTNVLWLREDGAVGDAWRRVAPDRPGRAVWPGAPYVPPPPPRDPCRTHDTAHLPPWGRREVEGGRRALEEICQAYEAGRFLPHLWHDARGAQELWVFSGPGSDALHGTWSEAVAKIVGRQEAVGRLQDLRRQALGLLVRREERTAVRLGEARTHLELDPVPWRLLGDSLLSLPDGEPPLPDPVPDPAGGPGFALPADWRDLPRQEAAQRAYQQFRKIRARRDAAQRLVPRLEQLQAAVVAQRREIEETEDEKRLRALLRDDAPKGTATSLPYRRFVSRGGYDIWVGRTEAENQALTFRDARPDDVWFHVKQYPGSHVILRCGRKDPGPEDVRDAAELAAHYSKAGKGSMIPVDYTRRKHVRKRPHGGPGQVLYVQEHTLYVTPSEDRLERLGARRDRLGE